MPIIKPRHHAGHEQARDRDIADGAVDHGGDAGRHQRGDGGGRGDDGGDERRAVALALHRAAERAADDGDIGGGRARHLREEHAEHGDDLAEAATDVADQRQRQIGDALHHIRRAHQLAHQQKEGIASSASRSIPSNIFWMIAVCETSVKMAPIITPAKSENATGTPR